MSIQAPEVFVVFLEANPSAWDSVARYAQAASFTLFGAACRVHRRVLNRTDRAVPVDDAEAGGAAEQDAGCPCVVEPQAKWAPQRGFPFGFPMVAHRPENGIN